MGGGLQLKTQYYTDYSIGYLTRGCFRKCEFCVNRNYKCAELHSPLNEFFDPSRKKICLLDDNVLSHPEWKKIFSDLQDTGKRFQFKQGLDERLLTPEKCEVLFSCKYDGQYIFAFDDIKDYDLIKSKLILIRQYYDSPCRFYVFCGFDRSNNWKTFWYQDIVDTFKRIELLMEYHCIPYIMRFNRYEESPFRGMYVTLARWCNQPAIFKKMSFEEFCQLRPSSIRYLNDFIDSNPEFLRDYKHLITMKWR